MIYIGVDPGKSGAFAAIDKDGQCAVAIPWDAQEFIKFARASKHTTMTACVEKVGAMPGQGVTSMFNFGKNVGYIEGVLETLGIPYQLVPPQKWKKEFSLGSDKKQSIEVCKRLFPDISLRRTDKCRTDDDGMAEALLMAEYARRKF